MFPHYQSQQIELSSQQLLSLVNHFLSNCNDIAVPEVPAKKKAKKSTFSKYSTIKDGRSFGQSTDKKESYPAWLMSQFIFPLSGLNK